MTATEFRSVVANDSFTSLTTAVAGHVVKFGAVAEVLDDVIKLW